MSSVWLIWEGSYEERGVVAICSTREAADALIGPYDDYLDVEERQTDQGLPAETVEWMDRSIAEIARPRRLRGDVTLADGTPRTNLYYRYTRADWDAGSKNVEPDA